MNSFIYLQVSIEIFYYPIFGIRQQKIATNTGKFKRNCQILQKNAVAALNAIIKKTNKEVQMLNFSTFSD